MKKQITKTIRALMIFGSISFGAKAQAPVTFETLTLAPDTNWHGVDGTGGFAEGPILFRNEYDSGFDAWNGFAYTNETDTITNGYNNQFSSWAGTGYNNSSNYGVVYDYGKTNMVFPAPMFLQSFYFTNNTLAARNMRDGDPNMFAKKFGGVTGDDPDYFKVITKGYLGGQVVATEEFFLADYRFSDNTQDYIVKDWTLADFSSTSFAITTVDSVNFSFGSSDTSSFGGVTYVNTPTFFCIDNIMVDYTVGISKTEKNNLFSVYPNPAKDLLFLKTNGLNKTVVKIYDYTGRLMITESYQHNAALNIENLNTGMYIVEITTGDKQETVKFIKE